MLSRLLHPALFLAILAVSAPAETTMLDQELAKIAQLQDAGQLSDASHRAKTLLQAGGTTLSAEEVRLIEYEIERCVRIADDYSFTRQQLDQFLLQGITGVTTQEIDQWIEAGKLDFKVIDGEQRFVGASRSNLFFRYPEIRARRISQPDDTGARFLLEHARRVRSEMNHPGQYNSHPRRFNITMTIRVLPDTIPAGQVIQCWMPYPQQTDFQSGVELLSSSPTPLFINGPNYPTRSLYFEQPSAGDRDTTFRASWTMESRPRLVSIDPDLVAATDQTANPYFLPFTAEKPPHTVFSDRIRALAAEIVGDETNPAVKARLIYDWLSHNKKYSYAREYSTLRNIPEYVLDQGYGDCGQIALTFIALCRAAGIPARWQSGWVLYPHNRNLHDWTEIHLAPYGWVPVDPDFAMSIRQHYDALDDGEKQELIDFYFGGIDGYRMAVNSDHSHPHFPPKKDFRSDNVDFQRGELESQGRNIYFNRFRYRLEVDYPEMRDPVPVSQSTTPGLTAPGVAR